MKAVLNPRKMLARRAKKSSRNVKATVNPRETLERAAKVNKTLVIEPDKSSKKKTKRPQSSTSKSPSVTANVSTAVVAPSKAPSIINIKTKEADKICHTLQRRLQVQDFGWMLKNKTAISKSDLMAILSSLERTGQLCKQIVQELYRTDFDFSETYALESLELVEFFLQLIPGNTKGRWYFIHHLAHVGIVEAILIKLENVASLALQRQSLAVLASLSDCPPIARKLFHPKKLGITIKVKPLFSLMLLLRGNPHDEKVLNPCCFILYNYCLHCPEKATMSMVRTPECLELLEWASHCCTADNNGLVRLTIHEIFKRMTVQMFRSMNTLKERKHGDDDDYAFHYNRPRATTIYDSDYQPFL